MRHRLSSLDQVAGKSEVAHHSILEIFGSPSWYWIGLLSLKRLVESDIETNQINRLFWSSIEISPWGTGKWTGESYDTRFLQSPSFRRVDSLKHPEKSHSALEQGMKQKCKPQIGKSQWTKTWWTRLTAKDMAQVICQEGGVRCPSYNFIRGFDTRWKEKRSKQPFPLWIAKHFENMPPDHKLSQMPP